MFVRFQLRFSSKTSKNADLLWHASEIFHKSERRRLRPNWNGLMDQLTSKNKFTKKYHNNVTTGSIHLNLSDENCTHSKLLYINDQAKHLTIEIPCVTFDQSL